MSEPLQTGTVVEEAERQEGPERSPAVQSAWDKQLARHGLSEQPAAGQEEGGAEPAQQQARAPRPPRREKAPAEIDPRNLPPARGFRERQERRQEREQYQRDMAELRQQLADMRALLSPETPPDADKDPAAYTSDLVTKAVIKALGGEEVVAYLQESHKERQERQQYEAEMRAENEFLASWGDDMSGWEGEYRQQNADAAKGYEERLGAFMQVCTKRYLDLGDPPQVAERKAVRGLIALTDEALQRGVNPAAYVDYLFRQTPMVQQQINGARRKQREENRETRERREAAAATSTLTETKAPAAPTTKGKLNAALEDAPNGKGRAGALVKALRSSGNAKSNLREMRGA